MTKLCRFTQELRCDKIEETKKEAEKMWFLYAAGSAFFAGITTILAKCGIKKTDSHVATAIRTAVILVFAWIMVIPEGSIGELRSLSGKTCIFLALSGFATGASWLCYFKALQTGDVNKVVPVDKSSSVLTILLATLVFHEGISWQKVLSMALILTGTLLMIQKKKEEREKDRSEGKKERGWLFYAVLSAVFASLTAILGKMGISGVSSNLGTALRTIVVLAMAWVMIPITGKADRLHGLDRREVFFICLSGVTTGASWLCYYRALKDGVVSVAASIDKLSILVSVFFSWLVFGEKLSQRAAVGLCFLTAGTLLLALAG